MNKVCPICEKKFHKNDYLNGDVSNPYLNRYLMIEQVFHTGCEWAIENNTRFVKKGKVA